MEGNSHLVASQLFRADSQDSAPWQVHLTGQLPLALQQAERIESPASPPPRDSERTDSPDHGPPDPRDTAAFDYWLSTKPRSWSAALAVRARLRTLPNRIGKSDVKFVEVDRRAEISKIEIRGDVVQRFVLFVLVLFRDHAALHFNIQSADRQRPRLQWDFFDRETFVTDDPFMYDLVVSIRHDAVALHNQSITPQELAGAKLWPPDRGLAPSLVTETWGAIENFLLHDGQHWRVWIDWYQRVVEGAPRGDAWWAAFTDVPGPLPWNHGPEAVNTKIAARLAALEDPRPIEGITSPIAIVERPDGRIGVEAGSLPTFPASVSAEDHARVLSACRSRADQLWRSASMPTFNGRSDYAEVLAAYLEWLPDAPGTGNIVLADGETRLLNKLFTADQEILPTGFASRLTVFLEDHIGLRAYYPEIERHYLTVRTDRLTEPLERDAVEGIQQIIRDNTPTVFEESVDAVMAEVARQVPEVRPPGPEDSPGFDPNRPSPPRDPIGEVDPQQSRNWIFASAFNRIWELVLKGKEVHEGLEGLQNIYEQLKPYVGHVLRFLKMFGGDGTPPVPPMIVT
jgi:hypothetical protein